MSEMQTLAKKIRVCKKCRLRSNCQQVVVGSGNESADIVFVGEAPGENEDKQGIPFIGRAGERLNELLEGIGLEREDVYITNIVKCRPPNNRDPFGREIRACSKHLAKQLELINPLILVPLGRHAAAHLLRTPVAMKAQHGKRHVRNGKTIVPMYHPAASLYNPKLCDTMREDFDTLAKHIDRVRSKKRRKRMKYDVMLVDGRNMLWRMGDAHYGLSAQLSNGRHVDTGGIFGFLNGLLRLRRLYGGRPIVVWEGTNNFRFGLYPAYKANRRGEANEAYERFLKSLRRQERQLRRILRHLGVIQYRGRGCEADDIICTLSFAYKDEGSVAIYSNDSDLHQLVTGAVTVIAPATGAKIRDTIYTPSEVYEKHGVYPKHIADFKALAGDPSDNIPGVRGVGVKTAAKLIAQYGEVDDIIKAAGNDGDEWPVAERFGVSILAAAELLRMFKQLTLLLRRAKSQFMYSRQDMEQVKHFLRKYQINSLLTSENLSRLSDLAGTQE